MVEDAGRVWADDMSAAYDEYLVPATFQPYADDLASRVARHRPRLLLELAAGTGALTRTVTTELLETRVTATDLNMAMVNVGAANVPSAAWRQADATQPPFDDASFDLVACQFGVVFFPDKKTAYAEVARVLMPDGHFLFNTWGPLAGHAVEAAVMAALADCFPDDPPSFLARVPHSYHDVERVRGDLTVAGFGDITIETVDLECSARCVADLARGYCRGTPLRPEIEARGELEMTTRAVTAALEQQFGMGSVAESMSALVVSARRA